MRTLFGDLLLTPDALTALWITIASVHTLLGVLVTCCVFAWRGKK